MVPTMYVFMQNWATYLPDTLSIWNDGLSGQLQIDHYFFYREE